MGTAVVARLRALGYQDVVVTRQKDFDLTREAAADRLYHDLKPQAVIHLAAAVGGIAANRDNPGRFFYANLAMGMHLIEGARRYGLKKFVQAGTICAYPKLAAVPFNEADLWNGYPEETNAAYGIAKKALLVMCQAYRQQYELNSIYLLPVNLYGPGDNFDLHSSHVIPALIRKCVEARRRGDEEMTAWGTGSATREFLYVDDCAEAIVLALEKYDSPEPMNLGSGVELSIHELTLVIARLTGFTGRIAWDTSKPDGQPRRRLDVSRAEHELAFRATTSLEDGLRRTVDWFQKQPPE